MNTNIMLPRCPRWSYCAKTCNSWIITSYILPCFTPTLMATIFYYSKAIHQIKHLSNYWARFLKSPLWNKHQIIILVNLPPSLLEIKEKSMEIKTKIFTMFHQVLLDWQTITKNFTRTRPIIIVGRRAT